MAFNIFDGLRASRLWVLTVKESKEILRNKYLLFLITIPPVVQLLILGASLDPQVRNTSVLYVDHSNTQVSRELVDQLAGAVVFKNIKEAKDESQIKRELEQGKVNMGLIIPEDFGRQIQARTPAQVQVLVDGADAYSAGIGNGYMQRTLSEYRPSSYPQSEKTKNPIEPDTKILYNPGQVSSWFFVPGVLGACLTLVSTLIASASVLKEREKGTMEQLLMTPASTGEILLAKFLPLVFFLLVDVVLALAAASVFFGMPIRGSYPFLLLASALYAFVGIGFGMLLGSVCQSQRQAQLTSFFINIPLILMSGTVVPFDTMPVLMQTISYIDPLRYYAVIARGVILKGSGINILWPELAWLTLFAILVPSISALRFKRQNS